MNPEHDYAREQRMKGATEAMYKVLRKLDADWTEAFPNGPDDPQYYLADFTRTLWRECRAALALVDAP